MTPDEQATKGLLLESLQASLRLMERSTEDGALFLLETAVRGVTKMHGDGLLDAAEVKDLILQVKDVFSRVHPSLAAQLQAGVPLRSAQLNELLDNPAHGDEVLPRVRAVLAEFRERGLRKPH